MAGKLKWCQGGNQRHAPEHLRVCLHQQDARGAFVDGSLHCTVLGTWGATVTTVGSGQWLEVGPVKCQAGKS